MQSALARLLPRAREPAEETKQRAWREYGLLVVDVETANLTWDAREYLRVIGAKLYGPRRRAPAERK
ncbi:hypothetical protein [Hyphomicrobium sp.]|uniref:hypothetical protein n=1 Tax=Hyphomicrobium sp. TaxID=82 RepID=UPI0025C4D363|nr:hypothetical protein [Hyphomicrobium sp.]MCC7253829.1 hypothetical protein [Hyphomicrobium sp.]